jgi:hypothetical protein
VPQSPRLYLIGFHLGKWLDNERRKLWDPKHLFEGKLFIRKGIENPLKIVGKNIA